MQQNMYHLLLLLVLIYRKIGCTTSSTLALRFCLITFYIVYDIVDLTSAINRHERCYKCDLTNRTRTEAAWKNRSLFTWRVHLAPRKWRRIVKKKFVIRQRIINAIEKEKLPASIGAISIKITFIGVAHNRRALTRTRLSKALQSFLNCYRRSWARI